ncbi:putative phosphonate metabolism protein [Bradyrhizobium sp. S3.14.4]
MSDNPRYAIYYTPAPEHPLTVAARAWLGRDAFAGCSPMASGGFVATATNQIRGALTRAPRRYGFHATLKAPFRLKKECSVEVLERALRKFVAAWPSCPIGPLKIDLLGGFFALAPVNPAPTLQGLASCIVEEFDRFRAPLSQVEFQRRLCSQLNEIETTHLVQWGYPYVFDCFRFHMTLTDRLPAEDQPVVRRDLDTVFGSLLCEDYSVDALSLFVQEHSGADFVVRSQFALRGPTLLREAV